jgi:DNA polymerase elongation subunit (family B)
MAETISELLSGKRYPLKKTTITKKDGKVENHYYSESENIVYGDTDSVYFKMLGITSKDEAIKLADSIGEKVNDAFPEFMRQGFNCQENFDTLIQCAREIVADRGLYITKKKYIDRVVDKDGHYVDPYSDDALKMMGVEIKKTDTPPVIQEFLKDVVKMILDGRQYDEIRDMILEFRKNIWTNKIDNIIEIGVTKSVNKLDEYYDYYVKYEKVGNKIKGKTIPQNVRAAINFNEMVDHYGDQWSQKIMTGQKIRVFNLKQNEHGIECIALSTDLDEAPDWFFKNFEIDKEKTLMKLIDDKLKIYLDAMNWEVPSEQSKFLDSLFEF